MFCVECGTIGSKANYVLCRSALQPLFKALNVISVLESKSDIVYTIVLFSVLFWAPCKTMSF